MWEMLAGSIASAAAGFGMNQRATEKAAHLSADMYQKRYQWTVEDLKSAGLNPMLAYSSGVGGSPSASPSGSSSADSVASETVAMDNQTRVATAQEALLRAQAENVRKEADIKGPKSAIMREVEDWLGDILGNSADHQDRQIKRKQNKESNLKSIRDFFGQFFKK